MQACGHQRLLKGFSKQISEPHPWSFHFTRSGLEPKDLELPTNSREVLSLWGSGATSENQWTREMSCDSTLSVTEADGHPQSGKTLAATPGHASQL